jgi:hypothetical protein
MQSAGDDSPLMCWLGVCQRYLGYPGRCCRHHHAGLFRLLFNDLRYPNLRLILSLLPTQAP